MLAIAEYDTSPKLKKLRDAKEFIFVVSHDPLRKRVLSKVGKKFRFNNEQFAEIAGVNVRTFQRQSPTTRISVMASENTMRLAELYKTGMTTFDKDELSFVNWLNSNVPALGNRKPIEMITSGIGAEMVKEELLRMEYGVI